MALLEKVKNRLEEHKEKDWFIFLDKLIQGILEDEVPAIGGQLTYFLLLSIFPFLIFFLNILSYTSIAQDEILDNLLIVLPKETQILLKGIVREIVGYSSDTLLSLGILLALWSGSLGISAIIRAVNKAYNVKKKRPYWRLKGLAIIFTIALTLVLIMVLSMLVFGELIGERIFAVFGATHVFYHIWDLFRVIITFFSMVIIFALLYKFSPTPEEGLNIKFKDTIPGALFAAISWIIASTVFSFYVNNFGNYSKTYGSLGGIIILLLWLYISSITIILGGEINGAYAFMKEHRKKP